MNRNIGYIICETAGVLEASGKIVGQDGDRVVAEVLLQDLGVKNRNGRYYAPEQMLPQLTSARTLELLKSRNLYGENGHPMSKDISRQQTIDPNNLCHLITKLWNDGNDVKAHVVGAEGVIGDNFNKALLNGGMPSFSLRALGTVKNTTRGAEVENITVITWDRVIYPSHKRAYTQAIVNVSESANILDGTGNKLILDENDKGMIVPVTTESAIRFIKSESANIHSIMESFDIIANSTVLLEGGRKVQMTDNSGSTLVINLEAYVQNQIMNYSANTFR